MSSAQALQRPLAFRDRPILPLIAELFFVLTFVIKAFTDGPYSRGDVGDAIAYSKYMTALIACICAALASLGKRKRMFSHEFRCLMLIVAMFTTTSVFMQLGTGRFSVTVTIELVKLAMPVVLAYCMLNALDSRSIYQCMCIVLAVCVAGYLVDLASQGVTPVSFLNADFKTGDSQTENSGFSDIALMLTFYFAYFRKQRLFLVISAMFAMLCFKRLTMIIVIIILIVSFVRPSLMSKHITRRAITCLKVLTLGVTLVWFWFLLPEQENFFVQLFGKLPSDFTSGRSGVMRYLWLSHFQSYGFGSANEVIKALFGVPFEMDLIKIAFELTPLATVLFVWSFWDVAGTSLWGILIVGYYMLNMITSDCLTTNFAFTIAYIVLGLVNQAWIPAALSVGTQSSGDS